MERLEVAISSDSDGQLWSCCVWDVKSNCGLNYYRTGGVASANCLSLVGQDYLAAAQKTKPVIHLWPLNSQQPLSSVKIILPGRANAMTFTPDGYYCVVAVEEKLYIWQVSSGALLAIVGKHYQKINCIKFCDDGSHFATAADDGMVIVWSLQNLIVNPRTELTLQNVAGQRDPLYSFSNHSLPVTDVFIGKGGIRSKLVSVSIDRTCKMYDLTTGELLLNLVFDKSLTAVTVDLMECNVFVGTTEGAIYKFSIVNPPRVREYFLNEKDRSETFSGHTKAVTCLSLSIDGETLLSGSKDEQLIVWHIPSRQKINSIPHKGAITNAFFTLVPKNMFATYFDPTLAIQTFQRTVSHDCEIEILAKTNENDFWKRSDEVVNHNFNNPSGDKTEKNHTLDNVSSELKKLKRVNAELYEFAMKNVLKKMECK